MQRQWTNPAEIAAYILAHLVGLGWSFLVTPFMSRFLFSDMPELRPYIAAIFFGHSLIVMAIVLGIFILLRGLFQSSAPPGALH
jgi:predicted membrane channel-forming protein YqfA (hemolysin III family)